MAETVVLLAGGAGVRSRIPVRAVGVVAVYVLRVIHAAEVGRLVGQVECG